MRGTKAALRRAEEWEKARQQKRKDALDAVADYNSQWESPEDGDRLTVVSEHALRHLILTVRDMGLPTDDWCGLADNLCAFTIRQGLADEQAERRREQTIRMAAEFDAKVAKGHVDPGPSS